MNKKLLGILVLLCSFVFFYSCVGDDDTTGIDEEWKAYNEKIVTEVAAKTSEYTARKSLTGNGTMYWKYTDVIGKGSKSTKITQDQYPEVTDSVVCRYIGWYLDYNGKKIEFDSTEGANNDQAGRGFRINTLAQGGVMGWVDMLQYMKVGHEVEVCIPQELGYGSSAQYNSSGYVTIPAYTTLWFDIKLLKIIPVNQKEEVVATN